MAVREGRAASPVEAVRALLMAAPSVRMEGDEQPGRCQVPVLAEGLRRRPGLHGEEVRGVRRQSSQRPESLFSTAVCPGRRGRCGRCRVDHRMACDDELDLHGKNRKIDAANPDQ